MAFYTHTFQSMVLEVPYSKQLRNANHTNDKSTNLNSKQLKTTNLTFFGIC